MEHRSIVLKQGRADHVQPVGLEQLPAGRWVRARFAQGLSTKQRVEIQVRDPAWELLHEGTDSRDPGGGCGRPRRYENPSARVLGREGQQARARPAGPA